MYKRDPRKQGLEQYGFTGPAKMQPIQGIAPPPAAPLQKSTTEQFTDMAKQRLMTTALDKGVDKGAAMISSAMAPSAAQSALTIGGAPAAQAGGLAASGGLQAALGSAGTAMPYVGMGLLAGKALGLFSQGGYVGPLAKATYAANGEKIGLEFLNAYNSEDMSKLSPLTKASIRRQSVEQASKLNPEDRAKFVDSLRARGITPDTMYGDNNQSTSILEQLFGIK